MAAKRLKRIAVAAWLGILALGIQSLIPALLAAEIEVAANEGGKSVFTLCVFGHLHSHADGKSSSTDDKDQGTVCPICIALQASPPFTAPVHIALPLPSGRALDALVGTPTTAPERIATAAYRSRAPPQG
jgi:hypothetical protein